MPSTPIKIISVKKFSKIPNGFTLIELLLVIALIGIVSSIVLYVLNPRISSDKSRDEVAKLKLQDLATIIETYKTVQYTYPVDTTNDRNLLNDDNGLDEFINSWPNNTPRGAIYEAFTGPTSFAIRVNKFSSPGCFVYCSSTGLIIDTTDCDSAITTCVSTASLAVSGGGGAGGSGGSGGDVCGDSACTGAETCSSCSSDCGTCVSTTPACGDTVCNGTETCSTCPGDCGTCPIVPACGDGACNGSETCSTCASDCGSCAPTPPAGALANADKAQIIFSLDCSGSMYACVDGSSNWNNSTPCTTGTAKFEAQRNAVINFINYVRNNNYQNVDFGITVYDDAVKWLSDSNGNLTPNRGSLSTTQHYDRVVSALNTNLSRGSGGNPHTSGCTSVRLESGTDSPLGFTLANSYYASNSIPSGQNYIRSLILITDTEPYVRGPYPACPYSPATQNELRGASSDPRYPRDFMRCVLAEQGRSWRPQREACDLSGFPACGAPQLGTRPADVETYGVVLKNSVNSAYSNIYSTYLGPGRLFTNANYSALPSILNNSVYSGLNTN